MGGRKHGTVLKVNGKDPIFQHDVIGARGRHPAEGRGVTGRGMRRMDGWSQGLCACSTEEMRWDGKKATCNSRGITGKS